MKNIKYILKQNQWFLWPYVLFFCVLSVYVVFTEKHEGFLILNPSEESVFDVYFKYITYLGDGIMVIIISLLLLIINRKWGLGFIVSFTFSGAITQFLKYFYSDVLRPSLAIGIENVHHVAGTELSKYNSFPSGHTTTAFAFFLSFAIILKNKKLGLVCFLFALISGYSRVYLSQHFPVDVLIGSLIGVVSTILVFSLLKKQDNGV